MNNAQEKPIEVTGEVIRLPLWKTCLDDMLNQGVNYGQVYESAWFEDKLKCPRDSMHFGLAISEIRRALEGKGYYLSGRGQKGNQFVILPPESNQDVMSSYQRAATDSLKRGVILGTNTRLDLLGEADRRKHESMLEKMAFKMVLLNRSQSVKKIITKHGPKLLE
jgi:hypothetical protein